MAVYYYELSLPAESDLEDIYDFTSDRFGVSQAVDYLRGLDELFDSLCEQPHLGRPRNEVRRGLRSITYVTDTTALVLQASPTMCLNVSSGVCSSVYATTKAPKWKGEHRLDSTSFVLKLDKMLIIEIDTIASQTNLLESETFKHYTKFRDDVSSNRIKYVLKLNTALMNALKVDTGYYFSTFSCKTIDGKSFSKMLWLVFKK